LTTCVCKASENDKLENNRNHLY